MAKPSIQKPTNHNCRMYFTEHIVPKICAVLEELANYIHKIKFFRAHHAVKLSKLSLQNLPINPAAD